MCINKQYRKTKDKCLYRFLWQRTHFSGMHYGEKTMIKRLYDFNGPIFVCLILKTKQRRKVKRYFD